MAVVGIELPLPALRRMQARTWCLGRVGTILQHSRNKFRTADNLLHELGVSPNFQGSFLCELSVERGLRPTGDVDPMVQSRKVIPC